MPAYPLSPDNAISTSSSSADSRPHAGRVSAQQPVVREWDRIILTLILKLVITTFMIALFFVFLSLAAFLIPFLGLAARVLHRRRINTFNHPSSHEALRPALSTRDLRRLPRFKHPKDEASSSSDDSLICAVCLDNFMQGQWCRELSGCGHVFHQKCVDKWLMNVASCPLCRTQVGAEPHQF